MVAAERAQPVAAGRTPSFAPVGMVLAIGVIGIAVYVASWAWFSSFPPVEAGSVSAVLGDVQPCNIEDVDIDADETACYVAPFAEGREVGVGFTIRNDAPFGMTIVKAEVIREGVLTPAVLEPQLTDQTAFGLTEGVPFEPLDVPAGAEGAIQFVGTFGDCETVAEHYVPSSGLSVSQAFLTVRWGVISTEVVVPLTSALNLSAPTSCP